MASRLCEQPFPLDFGALKWVSKEPGYCKGVAWLF